MVQLSIPVFEQIKDSLRAMIRAGKCSLGERIPSTRELCELYGASLVSVRRAVNELKKEGVLRGEYGKGVFVCGIPEKESTDSAVVVPQPENVIVGFWTAMVDENIVHIQDGMARYAKEHDMGIELYSGSPSDLSPLRQLVARGIPGALIFGNDTPEYVRSIAALLEKGLCFVGVDRCIDSLPVHVVTSDNYSGAYLATEHLLRHVGLTVHYLGTQDQSSAVTERYRGYCTAMRNAGFSSEEIDVLTHNITVNFQYDAEWLQADLRQAHMAPIHQLLQEIVLPTCLFCLNDYVARGVYDAAEKLGLAVGKDLFLVGYDDLSFARRLTPPLSSVRQDFTMIGYRAAALLDDLIHVRHLTDNPPIQMKIPVELVVRDSSISGT